jgi:hypothetical protein
VMKPICVPLSLSRNWIISYPRTWYDLYKASNALR